MTSLIYSEREVIAAAKKLIRRKPEVASMLLEGLSKAAACQILLQVRDELNALLEVNRAFSDAAQALVKLDEKDAAPPSI